MQTLPRHRNLGATSCMGEPRLGGHNRTRSPDHRTDRILAWSDKYRSSMCRTFAELDYSGNALSPGNIENRLSVAPIIYVSMRSSYCSGTGCVSRYRPAFLGDAALRARLFGPPRPRSCAPASVSASFGECIMDVAVGMAVGGGQGAEQSNRCYEARTADHPRPTPHIRQLGPQVRRRPALRAEDHGPLHAHRDRQCLQRPLRGRTRPRSHWPRPAPLRRNSECQDPRRRHTDRTRAGQIKSTTECIKPRLCRSNYCSPAWTRTRNRPINSRMLCQLSYRGLPGTRWLCREPRHDSSLRAGVKAKPDGPPTSDKEDWHGVLSLRAGQM